MALFKIPTVKAKPKPKPVPKPPAPRPPAKPGVVKPPSNGMLNTALFAGSAALPAVFQFGSAYLATDTLNNVLDNPLALTIVGGIALLVLLK